MLLVKGKVIADDLADLESSVEVLAAATGISVDALHAHVEGSRILSEAAQREVLLAIHSLTVLRQLNPDLRFGDAAFVADLLRRLYRGELGRYSRLTEEWATTRCKIKEAGEAAE